MVSGVGFQWGGYHNSHAHAGVPDSANQDGPADGAYTVHRPEHWAFAHTGLAQGETFGADHVRALLSGLAAPCVLWLCCWLFLLAMSAPCVLRLYHLELLAVLAIPPVSLTTADPPCRCSALGTDGRWL